MHFKVKRYIFFLVIAVFFCGCVKEIPKNEFVAYYEEKCGTELERGGYHFFVMPFSDDYEIAKWGNSLGRGKRVLFKSVPYSNLRFEDAFFINGSDTSFMVLSRKEQNFELTTSDSFVMAFEDSVDDNTLFIKNVSNGIGLIKLKLKNCKNLRIRQEEK